MKAFRLAALALLAFTTACVRQPVEADLIEQKLEGVIRIIMRAEGKYDLFVQQEGSRIIDEKYLAIKRENRVFIADVPTDKQPWLLIKRDRVGRIWKVEFHIRSAEDLGVGGYRQQSGKTSYEVKPVVIQ